MTNLSVAKAFHGCVYNGDQKAGSVRAAEPRQEIRSRYRFYSHFHPYVRQLKERLLRGEISGLQAADTDYAPGGACIPLSIKIALESNTVLGLDFQAEVPITFLTDFSEGADVFKAGSQASLDLSVGADARLIQEGKVVLLDPMIGTETPAPGAKFELPSATKGYLFAETKLTLTRAKTKVDGRFVSLAGANVLLRLDPLESPPGVWIGKGTQATLVEKKRRPVLYADTFLDTYHPWWLVQTPYPVYDLDFTPSGAYSVYNWELFFHAPLTIAIHLSKNQRFSEAQRWFHYVFDPTDDSDDSTPERFWKVRPFHYTYFQNVEEILVNLATDADSQLRGDTIDSINAWSIAPFRPHLIARYRQQAYMYKTVMAYLDNLIAWGDSLFRQDTGEAIDEALLLYVLAANILGPRPQAVPKKGSVRAQTYDNLRSDLEKFGTVLRDIEADLPFDLGPFPAANPVDNGRLETLRSLPQALYFCLPRNDKLLSYWDTVADRLFKIRNSLNISGTFRQVPLFEPPIDPGLLAKAAAAGVDVAAIVNGINQPLPLVRFQLLVQKAAEIVQEVKSLGNNLLSAMEKEDGEAMTILRAKHEREVMEAVEHVKYDQLQEAIKSKEGLYKSLDLAIARYTYYERQLGKKLDEIGNSVPAIGELSNEDKKSLQAMQFHIAEKEVFPREIEIDIAQDLGASGGKIISSHERSELEKLDQAKRKRREAVEYDMFAKFMGLIPDFDAKASPLGVGAAITFGGKALAMMSSFVADSNRTEAEDYTHAAGVSAKVGSYARREQEWAFQSNLAAAEINQIFKQLRAAQLREAIADLELKNHQKQMAQAEEIKNFLNEEGTQKTGKTTNKAFYAWAKREVKGLYAQCFQFAFDIAKKAERALQHELGNPELSYLQFGYLAGKEGLLAGEKLYLDIKRMEMAYHDLDQREYELTKHVSLLQADPLALIQLRATGRCTVRLPEAFFDMDGPGHYFRRIKTVALSIPCVTGPYAGVNCTLTLLKSSIRKTQLLRDGVYARADAEDDRFNDYFGSLQAIVTSAGQNDSGLFEANLHDERYLPFELSGAISEWQLELPADVRQFDYDTIADVILHIRYTARGGGGLLRNGAVANLKTLIEAAQAVGSVRLFSLRHEFPTEWAKFKSIQLTPNAFAELTLNLREEHYPFWSQGRLEAVKRLDLFAKSTKDTKATVAISDKADGTGKTDNLVKDSSLADLRVGKLANIALPAPTGKFTVYFNDNSMANVWLALTWGKGE
jgi:hypothetical protein